jgi:hypothetical protein
MVISCDLTRRVISRGTTHPGLLMAPMVAATPKQIAMARQTANSESHSEPMTTHFDARYPNPKTSQSRNEIINSRCHPITGGVVKSIRQSAVALGRGTAGRLGAIALTVVRSLFLNQQRIKTTGPTKLTSLAQPMMFNGASRKVPRHQWSCGREAAVWTIFVAAVCRRIIVLGSRRGFDTMLPPPFGAAIKF